MVVLLFLVPLPRLVLRFSVRIVDVLLLLPLPRLARWVSLALLVVDDSTLLLWLSLVVTVDVLLLDVRVDSLLVLVPLP